MANTLQNHIMFAREKARNPKVRALVIGLSSILIIVVVVVSVTVSSIRSRHQDDQNDWQTSSKFVKSACRHTPYPNRCVSSMAKYQTSTLSDLSDISVKVCIDRAQKAYDFAMSLQHNIMNERERAAWQDCLELFQDTIDRLNVCLSDASAKKDAPILLSAALTNQDTCLNGFRDFNLSVTNPMISFMYSRAVNISELVRNSLSMYKLSIKPSVNRRLLSMKNVKEGEEFEDQFPEWVSSVERLLLQASSPPGRANAVVAQDGSGNYRTIAEAVRAAPLKSSSRYVIYVKAGIYKENIEISKKMTNIMFVGDGKDKTVVTASKNVQDGSTTFKSATFAVSGDGFIARDMTFENTAGPQKQQAVALRVGADKSVVYRCSIKGYQDSLYTYSLRQFYREVDIYGTVDFIFGNAAAVIQNSNIFARKPMSNQKITITAQGRNDPNENTGISIHNCRVTAAADLQAVKGSIKTYLGRPWRQYSRTVFILSTLDDIIDPAGWSEWSGSFALNTLYYGEYMNSGPGAGTSRRVKWRGFHVINTASEASKFTVSQFIAGNSWIAAAGADFTSSLT